MTTRPRLDTSHLGSRAISPLQELGAYEAMWEESKTTFKSLAKKFASRPRAVPSDFVPAGKASECAEFVQSSFQKAGVERFGVRVHGAGDHPQKLRDAAHPVELLYYQGRWNLAESRSVAVVGTRNPSQEGIASTLRLVRELVKDNFTIVSGLATGIDTAVHGTAMECAGRTIAVIGTPLSLSYPRENIELQRRVSNEFLVISQVPLTRYEAQDYRMNRLFFVERNVTMSALAEATIIVEAGETSGTLIQATAALQQGRSLFILDSCFRNPSISWPYRFLDKGATRVTNYDDIRCRLLP